MLDSPLSPGPWAAWIRGAPSYPRYRDGIAGLGSFDVVLMVDVLEHLTHEDGAELLARIPGRVVICTPRDYFQNPEAADYPTENHRSLWNSREIAAIRELETEDVEALGVGAVLVRTAPLP